MSGLVVVTRPEPDASDYADELRGDGFDVLSEPMLRIQPTLFERPKLSDYDGVLVTSANAINAYIKGHGEILDIPVYCVGKHSAQAAMDMGFLRVISVDGTGADLLAYVMGIRDVQSQRFLHVCGRHLAFPIAGKLSEVGVDADMLVVYESVQAQTFSERFLHAICAGEIAAVSFFSKRTAECFVELAQEHFTESESESLFSGIKSLSISDAVLECVRVLSWHDNHVAEAPDRAGMIKLLKAYV